MADMRRKNNRDLLQKVKDRYKVMYEADQENRRWAMEDMKFVNVPGAQWDHNMKQERGQRPCYEFNKLRITCKRVINDMRANRAQGKIRATEDGDRPTAEIYEGLVRNIWNNSDADTVIDAAAEYQVEAGMGAWRVTTEYADDSAFEQDICIEEIPNPFCLYADPACRDQLKRDAEDWIYTEKISHKSYEAKYGKDTEKADFRDSVEFDDEEWEDDERVRVAEYWYKEPHKKELWLLTTGEVVDSESDEANGIDPALIERKREVMTNKIMWCVVSGSRVLEGPTEWAGSEFPFIIVYGENVVIDGKPYWWGLPRFAKDAQRAYNYSRTAIAETIAQAPQAKWWATAEQARGHTDKWAIAHKENFPFLLYNADPKVATAPQRMGGADVPVALIQESQLASEEIKATTGIYDASLGNRGNETSGRAIYARQQQGEIATFNFQDNMAKGIRRTYEIIIGLIPNIYDTERELRILGNDGAEDYVKVNQIVMDYEANPPRSVRVNDLATGKYDVTVTVGPNFSTQRQEAAETYGMLGQQFPELMGVAGDLVFKSMDLPYAEDIADRLRTILPPQVQQMLDKGKEVSPEVQQAMAQADQAMQQVQEFAQLVQAANEELQSDRADVEKLRADLKVDLANLKTAKAEFDKHIAEQMIKLIKEEAGLTEKQARLIVESAKITKDATQLEQNIANVDLSALDAAGSLDEVLSSFMVAVDEAMGSMHEKAEELEQKVSRKVVGGKTRRENGKLIADIEFDDGSMRSVGAVRRNGEYEIEPEANPEP